MQLIPPAITTLLILDNSGSMKASDPTNLRYTALDMLAALLDDSDQLGVIGFATASQPLTDGLISPRQYKSIPPIFPAGFTDIKSALTVAGTILAQSNSHNRTGVILLTDGKPEIERPYPEYEQETLALAHSLGVPVYAIALTRMLTWPFSTGWLPKLVEPSSRPEMPRTCWMHLQAFNAIQDRTVLGGGSVDAPGSVST